MFEELYIATRIKEHRLYSDDEVRSLPRLSARHLHSREWRIRSESARRLVDYLLVNNKSLKILEVGCGNGWLSNTLSKIPTSVVTGIDINEKELDQASRLFQSANLRFVRGDIRAGILNSQLFDVIVFAASLQYFPSLKSIIDACLAHLKSEGEIHIIDTQFYTKDAIAEARERSAVYYRSIGCPEMTKHYFHHAFGTLSAYNYERIRKPLALELLGISKSPFPWICIRHDNLNNTVGK